MCRSSWPLACSRTSDGKAGLWAIDTANSNYFETGRNNVLGPSQADAVLLQETKLKAAEEIATAKRQSGAAG